jgi:hypothetical protein
VLADGIEAGKQLVGAGEMTQAAAAPEEEVEEPAESEAEPAEETAEEPAEVEA